MDRKATGRDGAGAGDCAGGAGEGVGYQTRGLAVSGAFSGRSSASRQVLQRRGLGVRTVGRKGAHRSRVP